MEAFVLHKVGFLQYFCPKQGQDFKPSAAPTYPNIDKVPPPPRGYKVAYIVNNLHFVQSIDVLRHDYLIL